MFPRVKANTSARVRCSRTPALLNNLPLSVQSAPSAATFPGNVLRLISLTWHTLIVTVRPIPHCYDDLRPDATRPSWVVVNLTKLQRVLKLLARVVIKSPPFTRSVPLLRSLHWLSVKYRVHFKICLLTYKTLHEEQPIYLRSLIATSLPTRSLGSNRRITLSIPRIKTNTGARAFSSCAPSLWNNLPLSVRSATSVATFRRRLKTYLSTWSSPRRHRCAQRPVDVTE